MRRYAIDPARSKVIYRGESDGVMAMKFVNDQSQTTGELLYAAPDKLGGAVVTKFEKLPGAASTTSFRKMLGVTKPHELRIADWRFGEAWIELSLDLGHGPVGESFDPELFEVDDDVLKVAGSVRVPLGFGSDLFGVVKQKGAIMVSGVVDVEFELLARSAVH
jgi:hypothetical protein